MTEVQENWLILPNWLDQQFLQKALKDHYRRGSLTFSDYDIRPATNKGDNYLSQMFRVKATLKSNEDNDEEISVVVKSLPHGERAEQFMIDHEFFVKETKMFTKALPLLGKVLNDCGYPKLFATVYFQQGPPKDLLVLEDLKRDGFRPADRIKGLDLQHCILVFESIATFHAASLRVIEENQELKNLQPYWIRKNAKKNNQWIGDGLDELIKTIPEWKEMPLAEEWVKKLSNFRNIFTEKMYTNCDPNYDELNVLNHGDLWTSNIMFKYENNVPTALKFVDYQLSSYTSPVLDLLYFFFTSPQPYVREKHLNLLLESYHRRFEDVCQKLNIPVKLTLGGLRELFTQKIVYGFAISLTIYPITTAKCEDAKEVNDKLTDDAITLDADCFHSETFEVGMKSMLPVLDQHGLFD